MIDILYLSHTDIRSDSRILKAMNTALDDGYSIFSVGVELREGAAISSKIDTNLIKTIKLFSRKLFYSL